MARVLAVNVGPVRGPDGRTVVLAAGSVAPEWAVLGDHVYDDAPAQEVAEQAPPRAGAGSGRDAWVAYAQGKVDVDDDMGRDEIIAALEGVGYA